MPNQNNEKTLHEIKKERKNKWENVSNKSKVISNDYTIVSM